MENEKEKPKPKVLYAQKEQVRDIILEADYKNEKDLKRLRFICDDKEITCKLSKTAEEIKTQSIFKVKRKVADIYTIEDLEKEYPVLIPLLTNAMKEPQEIIVTYSKLESENEDGLYYYYMKDFQLKTLYYDKYHTDKENLNKQSEWEKKVKEVKII